MDDFSSLRSLADRSGSILPILVDRDSGSICPRDELLDDRDGRKNAGPDNFSSLGGSWSEQGSEGSSHVLRVDVDFQRTRSSSELFEESRNESHWKANSSVIPGMKRIRLQIRLNFEQTDPSQGVSVDDARTDDTDDFLSDIRRRGESDSSREES